MKRVLRHGLLAAAAHALTAHATVPSVPAAAGAAPSAAGGLLQAGLGLAVVIALVFATAWVVRRLGLPVAGGGDRVLQVVASTAVGQRERVVVVEVGSEWLVLGVAPGAVRHLHTLAAGTRAPQGLITPGAAPGFDAAGFAQKLRASLASLKERS